MTRRSLLSMLIVFFTMAVASFIGETHDAAAQNNPNVCFYTIDVAGIPPQCLPITVTTEWNCGGLITTEVQNIGANGLYAFPLNPAGAPPCPPACKFNWASLNGIINPTPFGQTKIYKIGNCCYVFTVGLGPAGEIYIRVRPC